jgi:hypothetical protein
LLIGYGWGLRPTPVRSVITELIKLVSQLLKKIKWHLGPRLVKNTGIFGQLAFFDLVLLIDTFESYGSFNLPVLNERVFRSVP